MTNKIKHLEAIEAIRKKLIGRKLSYKEIYNLMDEIAHQRLGDILTAYFVAAGFKEGFTPQELYYLTKAMVETGTKLHFSGIVADKHSTGGLAGCRVSMIIVPIIACAGFKIPKTSSRAITTPAGTADVMELLANVTFTPSQISTIVEKVGGCIVWGGHLGIAPADDVIIRVEEPLAFESFDKIIVSIMAKKVAVGANHIIFDLPFGKTMKIKYQKDARLIASKFHQLGQHFNLKIITDINETLQPAGNGIGPYLEAIDVLKVLEQSTDRSQELEKRAIRLAGKLLQICYQSNNENKNGVNEAKKILVSGKAHKKFMEIIREQGGNPYVSSKNLRSPAKTRQVLATKSGKIRSVNNHNLNAIARILGAPDDQFAGIYLSKRMSDMVTTDEEILKLYSQSEYNLKEAELTLKNFPIFTID